MYTEPKKMSSTMIENAPRVASRIYLASPWFNERQMKRMQQVHIVLQEWASMGTNRSIYAPYYDLLCPPNASPSERRQVYLTNLNEIGFCDIIVAVTDEKDIGTIFELGYASAIRDKRLIDRVLVNYMYSPICVGVALDLPQGAPFNLMLAEGLDVTCTSTEQLSRYLIAREIPSHNFTIE